MMEVKATKSGAQLTLAVKGRVDTTTAPDLSEALALDGISDLTLDLGKVDYMSSAGLRCLLTAQKTLAQHGGTMKLVHVGAVVREVLDMTGFSDFLTII